MDEIRRQRAETQGLATVSVLNQTIREQKTQITQLHQLVTQLAGSFGAVRADMEKLVQL